MKRGRAPWEFSALVIAALSAMTAFLVIFFTDPAIRSNLAAVGTFLSAMAGVVALLIKFRPRPVQYPDPTDQVIETARSSLLIDLEADWVIPYQQSSALGQTPIQLLMRTRPDAVKNRVGRPFGAPQDLTPGTSIKQAFELMRGELLILGEAGSGKTTMMVQLGQHLISKARQSEKIAIPIHFQLSEWTLNQPLDVWMRETIIQRHQLPPKIAAKWMDDFKITPLLDGLDELVEAKRDACVAAINAYMDVAGGVVDIVICCRTSEYEKLKDKLLIKGAVELKPLTPDQIQQYAAKTTPEFTNFQALVDTDRALFELLQRPLFLSIALRTFPAQSPTDNPSSEPRTHLFSQYAERMFSERGGSAVYTKPQMKQYLHWLGDYMKTRGLTTFYIENLQPIWPKSSGSSRLYYFLVMALILLIFFVMFAVALGLAGGLDQLLRPQRPVAPVIFISSLISGMFAGLGAGLLFDLMMVLRPRFPNWQSRALRIARVLALLVLSFVLMTVFQAIVSSFLPCPAGGIRELRPDGREIIYTCAGLLTQGILIFSWVGTVTALFVVAKSPSAPVIVPSSWKWSPKFAALGLVAAWIIGFALGFLSAPESPSDGIAISLLLTPVLVIAFGIERLPAREEIRLPNQGIRYATTAALRNALGIMTLAVVLGVLLVPLDKTVLTALIGFGFPLALGVALYSGGYVALQHLVLRLILYVQGDAPWNFARFLEQAAGLSFMISYFNGQYQFIHTALRDHFAQYES